ncbi:N-6 DNA methylase [Streptomyces sp. NPDC057239]|uniref:N-6 DNA methylase n=1 Tax=Streptomyces sp. NPDC057239 TaxID=3346061 RepID=UPI00362CA7E6
MAGVKRPAVSNWERRYPDYPAPAVPQTGSAPERFRAGEVLAWLSGRTVPVNALRPGEPMGTTYGDRFRAGLTGGRAGGLLAVVRRLTGADMERVRGPVPLRLYLDWLLYFVCCAIVEADGGAAGREGFDRFARECAVPEEKYPRRLPAAFQELVDHSPPGSPEEARQAFDLVLGLLRDAEAREGGDFLTPPSVSRTMAGALAAVQPAESVPHDPYCRAGELLTAYLDAAVAQGSKAGGVSGRTPRVRDLRNVRMNLRVHGVEPDLQDLGEGPLVPASGPVDPPGSFDTVITNPPFGGRLPDDVPPPSYWRYGRARRTEFDWLQYAVSRLTSHGRAAVLMPAGAAFHEGAARTVRTGLVENGVVECVMALPAQLFERTMISTHVWFLRAPRVPGALKGNVLFVAGADLGHSVTRTRRALSDDDVAQLVREYGSWCEAVAGGRDHAGTPGLSRVATPAEIAALDHSLEPVLYVRPTGAAPYAGTDPVEVRHRLGVLAGELDHLHACAERAQTDVNRQLGRYGW